LIAENLTRGLELINLLQESPNLKLAAQSLQLEARNSKLEAILNGRELTQ
jgi:hypothetical protein